MYCTVKEIIREVLDTDVPDSECVFAVVLTRGDVRHIAQDWSLTDDELETVMQRLDDAFEYGADVSIVHDVVPILTSACWKSLNRLAVIPDRFVRQSKTVWWNRMRRQQLTTSCISKPRFPWISSGSFAEAIVVEGADANASVTGDKNTVPMQLRLTGKVQMPNDQEFDLTGCFVTLEAWGDVSSERAIVRTRSISCKLGDDNIDQKIAGHVSFMGKNGIKGEVVMRNGQILLYAGGSGFLDGIGKGIEKASSTTVGVGATASMSAGEIGQAGLGGGVSSAAKTLSDYYIKRAEQYHPVIPIGAGNEVTLVFQDGFQLETLEEARAKAAARRKQNQPSASSAPAAMPGNTTDMLKHLQDFRLGDTVDPATGQVVTQ